MDKVKTLFAVEMKSPLDIGTEAPMFHLFRGPMIVKGEEIDAINAWNALYVRKNLNESKRSKKK